MAARRRTFMKRRKVKPAPSPREIRAAPKSPEIGVKHRVRGL